MIYAGIDEAGYGPLLGPLCVGCTAFEVPVPAGGDAPECLWKALSTAVCRSPSDRRRRIAVDDSKRLKGAKDGAGHPLRHLERGVIPFLAAAHGHAGDWSSDDALLAALAAPGDQHAPRATVPWHRDALEMPIGNDAAALRIAVAMLRTALSRTGIAVRAVGVRAMEPAELNSMAARIGNKATINFMLAAEHIDRVRTAAARAGTWAWIALDRQGGRTTYLDQLRTSFPEASLTVLDESDVTARYRLEWRSTQGQAAHHAVVSFELGGEERNLPVALASMAAKFARELHMRRLNAFFARHVPDVAPTAGYVMDGRRFLEAVGPTAKRLGIEESALVRCL